MGAGGVSDLGEVIGKTMRSVIQREKSAIEFEAETGERWVMQHVQDCCESCEIEDVAGDLTRREYVSSATATATTGHISLRIYLVSGLNASELVLLARLD